MSFFEVIAKEASKRNLSLQEIVAEARMARSNIYYWSHGREMSERTKHDLLSAIDRLSKDRDIFLE